MPTVKDDNYYQTLDADKDKIPDPLTALPSKVSLSGKPSFARDNWNAQPDLTRVVGNLYPLDTIDMDDVSVLRPELEEAYTSSEYHDDYQRWKPELHGSGGPSVDSIVNAIVQGGQVDAMFLRGLDWEDLKATYTTAFHKTFPGVPVDVDALRRVYAQSFS